MPERGWALVTGAARRIGRALALTAAQAGYDVVVHHHDSDAGDTVQAIEALGRRARAVQADLDDPAACRILAGGGELTLLVNSASLFNDDRIQTLTPEGWDAAMAANLRAPVLLSQAFAAALPAGAEGLIVNLIDQRVLKPTPQFLSYSLSKAGLYWLTTTLAQAMGPRIRVNAVGPGPTLRNPRQSEEDFSRQRDATILKRGADPADICQAVRYLLGAQAVTGQMLAVDGGQHLIWQTPDVQVHE